ncbi:hypothetical protein PIB30_029304 [Stylosanthes scabra]|uniref:Uncharacterized protein n=1 Tax=Stylosanthes scabra TaxID=79078 RepID=A0ABU6XBB9_9FABA|nr:hypothetical protein [Stylosanthes scabra]
MENRKEGPDGVEFHSLDQVVFMMWLAETLSDLKKTVQRNMRLPKRTPIIRMADRSLDVLPDRSCRYRVFWLSNDKHTVIPGAGPFDPAPEVDTPTTADLFVVIPPQNIPKSLSPATRIRVTLRAAFSDPMQWRIKGGLTDIGGGVTTKILMGVLSYGSDTYVAPERRYTRMSRTTTSTEPQRTRFWSQIV